MVYMYMPGVTYILACTLLTCVLCDKLLVVLLDGFRWDYVEKFNLPNFKTLYSVGARAEYLKNDFPTLSYPNYYTLMTGLHTEMHGMTGNYMYDVTRNESFLIGTNKEQYHAHWWEGGEPLWVTASKQNNSSYMFYWLGCEVTIRNTTPTFCRPYQHTPTLQEVGAALNESLELLSNGTTDFTAVYSEQPDYNGHKYGPNSPELATTLADLDQIIGSVIRQVQKMDTVEVNLIIMSDHGMTNVNISRTINLTDILNSQPNLYITVMESGAIASVYVANTSSVDKVYYLLHHYSPHMKVYKMADIPEIFHYKNGKYVSEITCIADPGWVILQPLFKEFPTKNGKHFAGTHGYSNEEIDMRGILYALGPFFKSGSRVQYVHAVDIYNLMCSILHITPAANNGSLDRISPLTSGSTQPQSFVHRLHQFIRRICISIM
ncbi:Ectonucleotide pyrophosphatase/phosphodiesterase member 6 [Bulinus truncatus]|nr:Ectonucleotide pyrophosphatase/phosphodiesterase member 6 [Bulinus truncatus]